MLWIKASSAAGQNAIRCEASAVFFCHLQIHRQSPDHPLQVGDPFLLITPTPIGGKELRRPLQELLFSSRQDLGPQPILPADLGLVLDASEFLQNHPGLELWRELPSL